MKLIAFYRSRQPWLAGRIAIFGGKIPRTPDWCEENGIELCHIQPGKPTQNGFAERFNGSFRREFLNVYLFESVKQVQEMSWHWRIDYNEERPHDSLGGLPPSIYRQTLELENSNLEVSH